MLLYKLGVWTMIACDDAGRLDCGYSIMGNCPFPPDPCVRASPPDGSREPNAINSEPNGLAKASRKDDASSTSWKKPKLLLELLVTVTLGSHTSISGGLGAGGEGGGSPGDGGRGGGSIGGGGAGGGDGSLPMMPMHPIALVSASIRVVLQLKSLE